MSETQTQKSRLQLVRERATQVRLGDNTVHRTRLVVSIDKLVEDPKNERRTMANLEEMVESVKTHGIIEPITVIALEDGRYQIVTGHRRYRAAKLAGFEQLEVLVRLEDDEQRRRIKSLISNIQRENVAPLELATAINALIAEGGLSQQQVADQLGKKKVWVSAALRLLDLPDDVKQKVWCTKLPVSVDTLTRIARVQDAQAQGQLVQEFLAGATQDEIREKIRRATDGQKPRGARKAERRFYTQSGAVVTVKSETSELTCDQLLGALREALTAANDG